MREEITNPGASVGDASGAQDIDANNTEGSMKILPTKALVYPSQAKWREKNPIANWAHSATRSAIRRGILTRQPCEVCGDPNAEAHHPDHRDPLRVIWVCRSHHKALHSGKRRIGE